MDILNITKNIYYTITQLWSYMFAKLRNKNFEEKNVHTSILGSRSSGEFFSLIQASWSLARTSSAVNSSTWSRREGINVLQILQTGSRKILKFDIYVAQKLS